MRNAAKPSTEAHDRAVCRNAADWLAGIVLMVCILSAEIRRRSRLLSQNPINEMLKIMVVVRVYVILCYRWSIFKEKCFFLIEDSDFSQLTKSALFVFAALMIKSQSCCHPYYNHRSPLCGLRLEHFSFSFCTPTEEGDVKRAVAARLVGGGRMLKASTSLRQRGKPLYQV